MPGIFGMAIFNNKVSGAAASGALHAMQGLLRLRSEHVSDDLFMDGTVGAGRCHTGILTTQAQPACSGEIFVWLDGETYNLRDQGNETESDARLLLKKYQADKTLAFLASIDGVFSAVIYDRENQTIHLCTDRHGLQHLYWIQTKDFLAWSSEYKAFLGLPGFTPHIDTHALQSFLDYGYFIDKQTWFKEVFLIEPATIISCDVPSGAISSKRYWDWNRIQPLRAVGDIDEAAEEWGRRFIAAVKRRSKPGEKTGITLSGGLDSRAILAAMPLSDRKIPAFTYGNSGCDDIRIATRVAAIKGADHSTYELTSDAWLYANVAAVWATDGEVCYLDTNGNEYLETFSKKMNICLNGIGGDAIHGGSYLSMKNQHGANPLDPYGDRGRRFIRPGFRIDESFYHVRMPFYDNTLVEFTMSLPGEMRKNARFYKKALLRTFPEYFRSIPWQKTGVPISYPEVLANLVYIGTRAKSAVARSMGILGISLFDGRICVSQRARSRSEGGRAFLSALLFNKNALYGEYIPRERVFAAWQRHARGTSDETKSINRWATLEIWLQQVFSRSLRPEPHNFPFVTIQRLGSP